MIRLQSVRISNFRGIRDGSVAGLTDVNVLVGRNNSGKSTVVEAIMRLLMQDPGGKDVLGRPVHDLWKEIRATDPGFLPELWYRQDQSKPIVLEGKLGDEQVPSPDREATWSLTVGVMQPGAAPTLNNRRDISGKTIGQRVMPFVAGVTLFRTLDAFNNDIEKSFWPQLLSNRRDKLFVKALNEIFSLQAEGFQLLPNGHLMVLFETHGLPLDLQGDGTRAALRCLMVFSMMKGTLFLMEEPESHQHPGSLERLALVLCKQAREQQVQLVISTHSAECVIAFLKGAAAAQAAAAVFQLALEEGQLTARRLDPSTAESLRATGIDVRFLDLYA